MFNHVARTQAKKEGRQRRRRVVRAVSNEPMLRIAQSPAPQPVRIFKDGTAPFHIGHAPATER